MDKQILQDQISGLKGQIMGLREDSRKFTKVQTLQEAINKEQARRDEMEKKVDALKEEILKLRAERTSLLKTSIDKISDTISKHLPFGLAQIKLEDGLFVGWLKDPDKLGSTAVPWGGLSGGQAVIFNNAVSQAFLGGPGKKIFVIEAGELDGEFLKMQINLLTDNSDSDTQFIINTPDLPDGFEAGFDCMVVKL